MSESLDTLRKIAAELDPSLQVGSNEVQPLLSALILYAEHGDALAKAAEDGAQAVSDLLAPPVEPPADSGEASAGSSTAITELQKQISDLQAQLATREATSQQTVVEHNEGTE